MTSKRDPDPTPAPAAAPAPHATPDDEAIGALIASNPQAAHRLLAEMGYSVEEWTRARNAAPAVEHGHRGTPASPAISQQALDGNPPAS